jgi:hypothetical protein
MDCTPRAFPPGTFGFHCVHLKIYPPYLKALHLMKCCHIDTMLMRNVGEVTVVLQAAISPVRPRLFGPVPVL